MSLVTDDGYMLRPNKRLAALTTIPGQASRNRYVVMDRLFGADLRISGVIFVASYGYDYVWPQLTDAVATTMPTLDMDSLRRRNLRAELDNFNDICSKITEKRIRTPELAPRWLLVAVNKIDLYFATIAEAADYYLLGSGSDFDARAQRLVQELGMLQITYSAIPVAAYPTEYAFRSARGSLYLPSQLTVDQCSESVACLAEKVGELDGS